MDEVFPVLAGVVVGLFVHRLSPLWLRGCALGVLGVVFGALASWISGELAVSWFYLVIDVAQVVGAGAMTVVLVSAWRRRRAVRAS